MKLFEKCRAYEAHGPSPKSAFIEGTNSEPNAEAPHLVTSNFLSSAKPRAAVLRIRARGWVIALVALFVMPLLASCGEREVLTVKAHKYPVEQPQIETALNSTKIRVWFVRESDGHLEYVPCERSVEGKDLLKESVAALLEGPSESEVATGVATEIPKGTEMIDVKDGSEGLELNLSQKFSSDGGSASIETRLQQLSRTVSEAVHDKKVFLDVEGKRLTEASGEGIEVQQPINL